MVRLINLVIYISLGMVTLCTSQVLMTEDQKLLEDYQWLYNTNIKNLCNPPDKSDILETKVSKCDFIDDFNMYPNPTDTELQLEFSGPNGYLQLFISDINGQLVFSDKINMHNGTYDTRINTSTYEAGIYVLTILRNDETFVRKLVVE